MSEDVGVGDHMAVREVIRTCLQSTGEMPVEILLHPDRFPWPRETMYGIPVRFSRDVETPEGFMVLISDAAMARVQAEEAQ